jgi:hypothetical protein
MVGRASRAVAIYLPWVILTAVTSSYVELLIERTTPETWPGATCSPSAWAILHLSLHQTPAEILSSHNQPGLVGLMAFRPGILWLAAPGLCPANASRGADSDTFTAVYLALPPPHL